MAQQTPTQPDGAASGTGLFSPPESPQYGDLKASAYEQIRRAIYTGAISANTRLSEASIAEEMEISRGPVREAFIRLVQEGTLERRSDRGVYVAQVNSRADVEELTSLSSALVELMLTQVARHITAAELDALDELIERMRAAADAGDEFLVHELETQFHDVLENASRHRRLKQMLDLIQTQYRGIYLTFIQHEHEDLQELVREHALIADALRRGRVDFAIAYAQRDLLNFADRVIRQLEHGDR